MAQTKDQIMVDPFSEMESIRLPKAPKGEPDTVYVGVNGRGYYVKRGQTVNIPKPVYEVLINSMRAEEEAESYERSREDGKELAQI